MGDSEDRQRAAQIPIDGRFPEMAAEVRRLLGWTDESRPFLTTRMASRKTGINHATISTMARGDRPSVASMMKFAEGLGGDKQLLLRLGGWINEDDPVNLVITDPPFMVREPRGSIYPEVRTIGEGKTGDHISDVMKWQNVNRFFIAFSTADEEIQKEVARLLKLPIEELLDPQAGSGAVNQPEQTKYRFEVKGIVPAVGMPDLVTGLKEIFSPITGSYEDEDYKLAAQDNESPTSDEEDHIRKRGEELRKEKARKQGREE